MTAPPSKPSDLDLSDDSSSPTNPGELSDWEQGFIEAYLYLHHVRGEPSHLELSRAIHALEHYAHTHHARARLRP